MAEKIGEDTESFITDIYQRLKIGVLGEVAGRMRRLQVRIEQLEADNERLKKSAVYVCVAGERIPKGSLVACYPPLLKPWLAGQRR